MKKGSDLTWRDPSPPPGPTRAISHLPRWKASRFEHPCPRGAGAGGKGSSASPMMMHTAGSRRRLPGGGFPGHQKQRLTPGHPAWGRGYPPGTGEDGEAPAPQHEEAATLGGGKALYNLLKQERRSPNAFWLTEANPKISFNPLIKKKKKKGKSLVCTRSPLV